MSKKNKEIIEAMLVGSGLGPQWEDDYFDDITSENRARFLNALIEWFELKNDHYMFHFNYISWMDMPSTAVEKAVWLINENDAKAA